MFLGFLYALRERGLNVGVNEWLTLVEALAKGHARSQLGAFYALSRAVIVHREGDFDRFDAAFASYFKGVEGFFALDDELMQWLQNPVLPPLLSDEDRAALEALDLDELKRMFEERLDEQNERHDGGNRWIGTGGTSPFGHGGTHPTGVRVGGGGGGRSAIQVAEDRRFKNLRTDRILDTRQISVALRRLRKLTKRGVASELDIDETVDESARQGGEIELVFNPPRKNRIKLMLLVDVGGSMDPHADLSERLFSAAHRASHFQAFEAFTFHNCPYETLYTDISRGVGEATEDVLKRLDEKWNLVFVGDAWMSPYELTHVGGAIYYGQQNRTTGLQWLQKLKRKCPKSVWLNPEPERIWAAESVTMVRRVFDMFPLTVDGLTEAVDTLRGARAHD